MSLDIPQKERLQRSSAMTSLLKLRTNFASATSPCTSPSTLTSLPFSPSSACYSPTTGQLRASSQIHKNLLTRLRPLPFQYVFSLHHTKSIASSRPTLLADWIPDIATFYKIYNNFPWESLPLRDGVHFFRAGVSPLWEHPENYKGGCLVVKVRWDDNKSLYGHGTYAQNDSSDDASEQSKKAIRCWEELCLMVCGGELQAVASKERDHVLGLSFSPRPYFAHISIWTKNGDNKSSIDALQRTVLSRLSEDLRPASDADCYYKRHCEHDGWKEAVGMQAADGNTYDPKGAICGIQQTTTVPIAV